MTRETIFALAGKQLRTDFESLVVFPHRQTKGQEAERLVRSFFRNHIPRRFDVAAGFIIDHRGTVSRQTDVILYDAHSCPTYRTSDEAAIVPLENVAAIVSVRSVLDSSSIEDAWTQAESIKSMSFGQGLEMGRIASRHLEHLSPEDQAEEFGKPLTVLLAFESKLSLDGIIKSYAEHFRKYGIFRHLDLIVVLDSVVATLAIKNGDTWSPAMIFGGGGPGVGGLELSVLGLSSGEHTLDSFFRLLLGHLSNFPYLIPHPGFQFNQPGLENSRCIPLGTFTEPAT